MDVARDPFDIRVRSIKNAPAIPVAVCFVCGIYAGFAFPASYVFITLAVLMVLTAMLKPRGLLLLTAIALIGAFNSWYRSDELPGAVRFDTDQRYEGTVADVIERDESTTMLVEVGKIDSTRLPRAVRMSVTILRDSTMSTDVSPGIAVTFTGRVSDPASRQLLPDERDYVGEQRHRGIVGTILTGDSRVHLGEDTPGLIALARRTRTAFIDAICNIGFDMPTTAFVVACLTGDDTNIAPFTRQMLSAAGIAHILALSGMHVAILTMLFGIILLPLRPVSSRYLPAILMIVILWFFALITGLSPSVVRAVTMATVLLMGRMLERGVSSFHSLALAAIVILMIDPYSLFSIGFQISFAAVWGIVAVGDLLRQKRFLRLPGYVKLPAAYLVITLVATIMTAPLVAWYFHIFPLLFIPGNMVIAMLLPVILTAAIATILLSAVAPVAAWVPMITDRLYGIVESMAGAISRVDASVVGSLYPPLWCIVLFYAIMFYGITAATFFNRRRVHMFAAIILLAFTAVSALSTRRGYPASEWHLHGVYTGTALMVTEDRRAWLISDCATDFATRALKGRLEPRLQYFLGRRGIDSLSIMPRHYRSPLIDRRDNAVNVGGTSFVFVSDERQIPADSGKVDYLVVTKGVENDIDRIVDRFRPANTVLSASLNARISKRLQTDLKRDGVEALSLRDTIVHSSNAPLARSSR